MVAHICLRHVSITKDVTKKKVPRETWIAFKYNGI